MNAAAQANSHDPSRKIQLAPLLNRCVYAGIGAYVLFAVLGFLGSEVIPIDESLQLLGGREVLEGRIPHRDFWSMYPPLNFYINGLVFRVWSASFMVARLVSAAIYGITVLAISRYVNKGLKGHPAPLRCITTAAAIFCLTRVLQLSQNNTILSATLVLTYFVSELEYKRLLSRRALLICGVAGGVLVTMRLNLGLYVIASIGATILVIGGGPSPRALSRNFKQLITFLVPAFVVDSLFLLSYGRSAKGVITQIALAPNLVLRAGHIFDVSRQVAPYYCLMAVVGFALLSCQLDWRNRSERTLALSVAVAALALAAVGLLVLSTVRLLLVPYAIPGLLIGVLIASQAAWRRFPPTVFVGLCFLISSLQHYLIRADGLHLYILSGAVAIVTSATIVSQPQIWRLIAMGLLFWLMMQFPPPVDYDGIAQWLWPLNPKAVLPALRVIASRQSFLALGDAPRLTNGEPLRAFERRFYPDADELSVIRYVDRFAPRNDAIFMGLASHDRTRVNDARLSWMMPRPLASHYLELEPGIITSESVQREVVQSLRLGVRWLVLQDTPNTGIARYPFPRSGVLDQYIAANFRCAVSFGKLHVCCRPAACPSL